MANLLSALKCFQIGLSLRGWMHLIQKVNLPEFSKQSDNYRRLHFLKFQLLVNYQSMPGFSGSRPRRFPGCHLRVRYQKCHEDNMENFQYGKHLQINFGFL